MYVKKLKEQIMADLEMNLYDANKQLMENEPPMDPIMFNKKTYECAQKMIDGKYWMLLCHERRDYTVFNLQGKMTVRDINKDIIECLKNRGIVLAIDEQSDGNYEIWIRDKKTKDNVIYYLFNYEFGVIEYE